VSAASRARPRQRLQSVLYHPRTAVVVAGLPQFSQSRALSSSASRIRCSISSVPWPRETSSRRSTSSKKRPHFAFTGELRDVRRRFLSMVDRLYGVAQTAPGSSRRLHARGG
jgi:hypothetical protein